MNVAAMSRPRVRSVFGLSTVLSLALLAPACGGGQLPSHDGGPNPDTGGPNCANAGCAAPPMCSTGCTAICGCCSCSPGQRAGDLVCTEQGCYAPAPASDGGTDAAHDAAGDGTHDAAGDGGWTPAAACALPFEVGPCDAAIPVYAFVGGACVKRTYGGCQGNDNRFFSWEECVAACVAPALPGSCPPNRVDREICVACGPAGGCAKTAKVCALVCSDSAICADSFGWCFDGVCQVGGCI